jgi:hypothetical protein
MTDYFKDKFNKSIEHGTNRIERSSWDKMATEFLSKILLKIEMYKFSKIKIPESINPGLRYRLAEKGQTLQEYVLSLILKDIFQS